MPLFYYPVSQVHWAEWVHSFHIQTHIHTVNLTYNHWSTKWEIKFLMFLRNCCDLPLSALLSPHHSAPSHMKFRLDVSVQLWLVETAALKPTHCTGISFPPQHIVVLSPPITLWFYACLLVSIKFKIYMVLLLVSQSIVFTRWCYIDDVSVTFMPVKYSELNWCIALAHATLLKMAEVRVFSLQIW